MIMSLTTHECETDMLLHLESEVRARLSLKGPGGPTFHSYLPGGLAGLLRSQANRFWGVGCLTLRVRHKTLLFRSSGRFGAEGLGSGLRV